jgi:hypothetical protein
MDFTHVNNGSTSGQGIDCNNHAGDSRKSGSLRLSFSFLFTGDESWSLFAYMPITSEPCGHSVLEMLTKFNGPSRVAKKTMATVSFNGTGLHMINVLPQNQKMDAEYFADYRAYYAIIGFDLLSNRKELPTEKMRCPF